MIEVLKQHPLNPSKYAAEFYGCTLRRSGMFSELQSYYTTIYSESRWRGWTAKKGTKHPENLEEKGEERGVKAKKGGKKSEFSESSLRVELAGIEPASKQGSRELSTCVVVY